MKITPVLLVFLLTACTGTIDNYTQKQATVIVCVPNKAYSKQDEIEILKEKSTLPPDSMLLTVIEDWANMRAENRACIGEAHER